MMMFMETKTVVHLWKISLAALLLFFLFNMASCADSYRSYTDAQIISLPLHFTFGIKNTASTTSAMSIGCGGYFYRLLSDAPRTYVNCATNPTEYFTHNATRYTYKWDIDFDAIVTVYNPSEMIPISVGTGQKLTSSADSATVTSLLGDCSGNNICYTDLPLCGDGICDTTAGERCWNCPADCATDDAGYSGICVGGTPQDRDKYDDQYGGCTRCQSSQVDTRGCISKYSLESGDCVCDSDCGWTSDVLHERYTCVRVDKIGNSLTPGKCCLEDFSWDPVTKSCTSEKLLPRQKCYTSWTSICGDGKDEKCIDYGADAGTREYTCTDPFEGGADCAMGCSSSATSPVCKCRVKWVCSSNSNLCGYSKPF